jgi:hypothetical protein
MVGTDEGNISWEMSNRGTIRKGDWYACLHTKNPFMVFPAADPEDRRHQTMPLLSQWLSSSLLMSTFHPFGRFVSRSVGRRRASAMPWLCFLHVRRMMEHSRTNAGSSVPSSPEKYVADTSPASLPGDYLRVFSRELKIGRAKREISVLKAYMHYFEKPYVHGFPTVVDRVDHNSCICPT